MVSLERLACSTSEGHQQRLGARYGWLGMHETGWSVVAVAYR
jgi:hypothetical protein